MFEAIVIGGGPAGLQAALTLGRLHRRALLLDSGAYRNAAAEHMHNFAGYDGRSPTEYRAAARADLEHYDTIEVRDTAVRDVRRADDGFEIETDAGTERSATVLLATGLRDQLPAIPGVAEAWGREVVHCPFCHGHEFAGKRVLVLGDDEHSHQLQRRLSRIGAEPVSPPSWVESVQREPGGGLRVRLREHDDLLVDGMFVGPTLEPSAPFAQRLGADLHDDGCLQIDPLGRTSVDGLYAAGDSARQRIVPAPLAAVLVAASSGLLAATALDNDLLVDEV